MGHPETKRNSFLDLNQFLEKYPGVRLATAKDNTALLRFFNERSMPGKYFSIRYDRSPDFFKLLDLHSDQSYVFIHEKAGSVVGLGTILVRKGFVGGKLSDIAYLGDLRIKPSVSLSKLWREVYADLLNRAHLISELRDIKAFYTCLVNTNHEAKNSLSHPKQAPFQYQKAASYQMIMAFSQNPFHSSSATQVESDDAFNRVLAFYKNAAAWVPSGYDFFTEIPQRLSKWPGLKKQSFIYVEEGGTLQAACAVWSPSAAKRTLIKPRIGLEIEFKTSYITHLVFNQALSLSERDRVFRSLLIRAKKISHGTLSFAQFDGFLTHQSHRGFLTHAIPMAIYEVTQAHSQRVTPQTSYGFEMALV